MSKNPWLTIVVVCYKNESVFEECLNSVLGQDLHGVEVVVVDDCSPDLCGEIAQRLLNQAEEKKVCSVRYVRKQENEGLGLARRTGFAVASGDYISFVDGDDIASPNYIRMLRSTLDSDPDLDVVVFNFKRFSGSSDTVFLDSQKSTKCVVFDCGSVKGDDFVKSFLSIGVFFMWRLVTKRSLLTEEIFSVERYYEDMDTVPFIVLKARTIAAIECELIGYRISETGIMRNPRPEHVESADRIAQRYASLCRGSSCESESFRYFTVFTRAVHHLWLLENAVYGPIYACWSAHRRVWFGLGFASIARHSSSAIKKFPKRELATYILPELKILNRKWARK